jgi:hypothetical protein
MNNGGFMKWAFLIVSIILTWSFLALAQVAPLPEGAGVSDIFLEVVRLFKDAEGLSYQYKIAGGLFVVVAISKNSALEPYWEKLGKFKPFVAPVLSLVAFLFMVQPFTLQAFLAAITTGAAAGYFAQILDALKVSVPKVNLLVSFVSDIVGKIFKKPQQ